ncbi:MAG: formate dehydrogenase subunit alpha [Candidatus Abyssobacteria bacterium SURF_17]|uniref:Formate dehydrogenase subunit alpha n=1 Tax=Candidatus Abyssobacteria bacterium SURF_17 TaxID=2093361 RepID=A0A419F1D3_9BACT|nr:MAG: formate dehydrogenase subunit alpha [Candidatus Abyssubacteria bacterium SURF_17]
MTNSVNEIESAACIFAIGTNTTVNHPVIGLRVKKAVKNGAKLIVANPKRIRLCHFADIWLRQRPGTDVVLLMGMMRVIVDKNLVDEAFVKERCENYEAFKESLAKFDLDFVEKITGVPREQVTAAAEIYATTKPGSILYAMGITQHTHGTDNVLAVGNLAMLTGNVGKPSSGVNPLRGQNNVQGACDMGGLPNVFTGYQSVTDEALREKFGKAWKSSLSPKVGITLMEMLNAAGEGKVRAMYIMGENPMLSDPDITHVRHALESLDFLVVQDIFLTETAQVADVVLPAATFAEKDGTFTNTERRVQRIRKAIEPIGDSRPDWQIISDIATRMGRDDFSYESAEDIFKEIAQLTPQYAGMSYERLEDGGLQWPCPTKDHPGTPTLHIGRFSRGKGRFMPLEYKASVETPDEQYPLVLTTDRNRYHYHTGTMTRRVPGLNILKDQEFVEMNTKDANALKVDDGEMVKVTSRRGEVLARVRVTDDLPPGTVSMTFHFAESPANVLTLPALDPVAKIPAFKVCAVRVEKIVTARTGSSKTRS